MSFQQITDQNLVRSQAFIGSWTEGAKGETFSVFNPATGDMLGDVASLSHDDAWRAIDSAAQAAPGWQKLGVDVRYKLLKDWAVEIRSHREDLGKILTQEQGKPLKEAIGEVVYAASFLDWFAEAALHSEGSIIPSGSTTHQFAVFHEPVGPGVAITPWNFPAAMVTRKVGPALAAGCPIVLKPSENTPYTALALLELANRANIPPGVFSIVTCSPENTPDVGCAFTSHPQVRKISFTGSTAVGKFLAGQCAENMIRTSMELGGNAPFIVFRDADIEKAVEGLISAKFKNAGQVCVAANRVLIEDDIYDLFLDRLVQKAAALTVGNGMDKNIQMGPLIDETAVEKVQNHIGDAVKSGASVVFGGNRHKNGGTFFQPTILRDVTPEMQCFQNETFGPLAAVSSFSSEAEAVTLANATPYGLAAYYYTNNRKRAWRVGQALRAGIVCENTVAFSSARAPFGGYKHSGFGREGGIQGLREWQEVKYRCIGDL